MKLKIKLFFKVDFEKSRRAELEIKIISVLTKPTILANAKLKTYV